MKNYLKNLGSLSLVVRACLFLRKLMEKLNFDKKLSRKQWMHSVY